MSNGASLKQGAGLEQPNPSHRAYQDLVLALRNGPYLEFPSVVGIETMALCNAACEFCPYPVLERKGAVMPDTLIEKILDDIQGIESRPPFRVNLSRVNEPFLDSRIYDISSEINRRFPEAEQVFFSNATPLNERNLLRLSKIQNVCFLNLSVNDHRPEQYERVMRLPWARTIQRLDLIHAMKSQGVLSFPVVISRLGDGSGADLGFLEWVRERYPLFQGAVSIRGDWMGAIPGVIDPVPDVACSQWFKLHFLSDGRSPFCCMDCDAKWGVGNATRDHAIHAIYNHPARRQLRLKLSSRLQVDPCKSCAQMV